MSLCTPASVQLTLSASLAPLSQPDDIAGITALKAAQKHLGVDLDAMNAIATALKERSLEMFESALRRHKNGRCFGILRRIHGA